MRRRALFLLVLSLLVAACSDGGAEKLSEKELRALVLQPSDLPHVFVRFEFGPPHRLSTAGTARESPTRFGRRGGWVARYRRPGSLSTRGPLVVESTVDLFEDRAGAKRELEAYLGELGPGKRVRSIPMRRLGDDAHAVTYANRNGAVTVRFFTVAWREGDVTASVSVNGFERGIVLRQAILLARKQQQHITAAVSS